MPLVSIPTALLCRLVGRSLRRDELVAALQALGNDVEDTIEVRLWRCSDCRQITEVVDSASFNQTCQWCGGRSIVDAGTADVIRISLLPVRPDMFDAAGLARALRGFLGLETGLPSCRVEPSGFRVTVRPGLETIRPHIAACVVRGLTVDDETLRMLMKLQENLHWALGRDRRRASIGVYDLDTVEPDFEYGPVGPEEQSFVPLFGMPEGRRPATPREILQCHPKGVAYRHLLEGFDRYPLLTDSTGRVLSMPPIINSDETRVTPRTRNLLIDVTGPDSEAVRRTLAVIAANLADYGSRVESVVICQADGSRITTPDLTPRTLVVDVAAAATLIGVELADPAAALARMRYGVSRDGDRLTVAVPAWRADIMHERDIVEDIAIGVGYEAVNPELVPTMTVGQALPIEELAALVRRVMTGMGFLETMTPVLTSEHEHYEMLRRPVPEHRVRLANPISVEQTICRGDLLSGLLATLRANTTRPMPQTIFEIGDCFALADGAENGVRTCRRVAAAIAGPRAGFAEAKSVLEALARELGVELAFRAVERPEFIAGRCAGCVAGDRDRGVLGEIHPEVLEAFAIGQPVAIFEFELTLPADRS